MLIGLFVLLIHATEQDLGAVANRLIDAELGQGQAFETLQELTDLVGHRLSGSPQADAAVAWAVAALGARGLAARKEPVMVPHWVRGSATFEIVAPARHTLVGLALGGSIATPAGGLAAPVLEVQSFQELTARASEAKDKIVLFNRAMERSSNDMSGYGAAVPQRSMGAIEAAKVGAVAALVRSVGTASYRLPHTGQMRYDEKVLKIPAAALTAEDADLISRLLRTGREVSVHLELGCQTLDDVASANVVAECRGREKPDEIVLIGAHLDSWDVGTGALDDGAGVAICIETLRLLKALELKPRRTIRAVLFMNEENGLRGGKEYASGHASELASHVAAIESDSGAARPLGFHVQAGSGALARVRDLVPLLVRVGATDLREGNGGADISPLRAGGVPLLGLRQDVAHYFDYHHTPADTLDKVDRQELAQNAAALAVMAYALAEMPDTLPRMAPSQAGD